MTYKNVKFDDSAVIRSLEKLAIKNGTVKPEELKKTAATKAPLDLTPSADLSENIMKLCSGLRAGGFTKQALEIETKFVNLKQAEVAMYELTGETGEDVVERAHPEGSHEMKGLDGDATIEDLIDISKQMRQVALKPAKGKLATNQAINLVKLVLAQDAFGNDTATEFEKIHQAALAAVNTYLDHNAGTSMIWTMGPIESAKSKIINLRKEMITHHDMLIKDGFGTKNPYGDASILGYYKTDLKQIRDAISKDDNVEAKETIISGISSVLARLEQFKPSAAAKAAPVAVTPGEETPAPTATKSNLTAFITKLDTGKKDLAGFRSSLTLNRTLNPQELASANKWIGEQVSEFDKVVQALRNVPEDRRDAWCAKNMRYIDTLIAENAQFETDWVE